MKDYTYFFSTIEKNIESYDLTGEPRELYDPVRYILSLGGKRLRPVLVLMGNDLFDGEISNAIPAALAIELFHNFTLIHDDIMDKAPLRRGKPTVHHKWNETMAILSGDLMMIKATDCLCETPTQNLKKLLGLFNKTAAEVCEGQQWDMNFESQDDVTAAAYIHMITLKTAVLLGCALKLGAYTANAPESDCDLIYEFGKQIGIAFQIQDDLLDSFGEGASVGKKIGGDISSNKKTLLLIEAFRLADPNATKELNKWLAVTEPSDEKINAVLHLYEQLGVKAAAESLKSLHLNNAFEALNKIQLPESKKYLLRQTAIDLMERIS